MVPTEDQLQAFFSRIEASGVFGKSVRRRALLEHLIRAELAGQGDALKAYSIGLDVLGRGDDFDPSSDSIVRVEIGRLRDGLDAFYATPHADGQIRVSIPKGGYRPLIAPPQPTMPSEPAPQPALAKRHLFLLCLATIVIAALSFASVFGFLAADQAPAPRAQKAITLSVFTAQQEPTDASSNAQLREFTTRLRNALTKRRALTVLSDARPRSTGLADFSIVTRVVGQPVPTRIGLELIQTDTMAILWSKSYPYTADMPYNKLEKTTALVTGDVFPQILNALHEKLSQRPVQDLDAWELYLLATRAPKVATNDLESEVARLGLAERAVRLDPDLGQAHAVLAEKIAYLSSVDATYDSPDAVSRSQRHAGLALETASDDPATLFNLALQSWHLGNIEETRYLWGRLEALDPYNGIARFLDDVFPYSCVPPPDEIIASASVFDSSISSDNPFRWVTLTWLSQLHMNRGNYEIALDYSAKSYLVFRTPDSVMRYAVILNALGRADDAITLIRDELPAWPNLDPWHFASVTMPRRCKQADDPGPILDAYNALAANYAAHSNPR